MTEIKSVSKHARFYPMLGEEAIAELAADIKENGQLDPITVDSDGVLLDGRNRLKACEIAGVDPVVIVYDPDDEGSFVRSRNERRHQSTGSRAMSTALSLQEDGLRGNGRWKRGSVDNGGSAITGWEHRMKEAGLVLDELPELADAVKDGEVALDDAYRQAVAKRKAREAEERARIEEARDEQAREDKAGRYFDNHQEAQDWLNSKPQGTFETMRGAYAAYLEHDREARRAEQKKREAERREKEEREDLRKRIAARLSQLAPAVRETIELQEKSAEEREAILSNMSDYTRQEFEEFEERISW